MEYFINYNFINFKEIQCNIKKMMFIKDKNSIYVESSKAFLNVAKEKSIVGKSDYDLIWDFLSDPYRKDDSSVLKGNIIEKIEPFFMEGVLHIVKIKKIPIVLQKEIIGLFGEVVLSYSTFFTKKDIKKVNALIPKLENQYNIFQIGENFSDLTKRQSECLFFYVRGKPAKEIARLLKNYESGERLSPRTIEDNLKNVMLKWDCNNKSELIDNAFKRKFFKFLPFSFITGSGYDLM